jgi:hypothetical protein
MEVRQALEQALAENIQAAEETQKRIRELIDGMNRLREERRGLELALQRYGGGVAKSGENGWANLTRPEAVLRVMQQVGRPVSPTALAEFLAQLGREDGPRFVSAALTGLKQRGKVRQLGRGLWVLSEQDHREELAVAAEA